MPIPLDDILSGLSPERRARIADLAVQFESEESNFNATKSAEKGRFVLYREENGRYRFRLVASNGSVLLDSTEYSSKEAAQEALDLLRRSAVEAEVTISAA